MFASSGRGGVSRLVDGCSNSSTLFLARYIWYLMAARFLAWDVQVVAAAKQKFFVANGSAKVGSLYLTVDHPVCMQF